MKFEIRNRGLHAINKLNYKAAKAAIPPYCKNQNPPLLSYRYIPPISIKIFNYRDVLQRLITEYVIGDPSPVCACTSSKHCYKPAVHIFIGDLSIVEIKKT